MRRTFNPRYHVNEEPIVLSKSLMDLLLKEDEVDCLIALYIFYYYTAKWQKTNQPKATTDYVSNALHWHQDKVRRIKRRLKELGLIEDVVTYGEGGKITGHYIHVNFIWSKQKNHPPENQEGGTEKPPSGFYQGWQNPEGNALSSDKLNALNYNNKKNSKKSFIPPTIDLVRKYCQERNNKVDPDQWFDFYTSKGWMIGKNHMKDWQAAVRTWERGNSTMKQSTSPDTGSRRWGTKVNYNRLDREL